MSNSSSVPGWLVAEMLLRASKGLLDELHRRLAARGHPGMRPAHGYTFRAIGTAGATAGEIGSELGITKQAAGQMVDELVRMGYVERTADSVDRRRRLLRLTARGLDCLDASAEILDDLLEEWRSDGADVDAALNALVRLDTLWASANGLRPVW